MHSSLYSGLSLHKRAPLAHIARAPSVVIRISRNDRNGHRRRILRARVKALGLPCAICGAPIDYSLPAGDPWSYELDEIIPVSLGGSELDPENVQPAHRICNERKGNRIGYVADAPAPGAREPQLKPKASQDWSS